MSQQKSRSKTDRLTGRARFLSKTIENGRGFNQKWARLRIFSRALRVRYCNRTPPSRNPASASWCSLFPTMYVFHTSSNVKHVHFVYFTTLIVVHNNAVYIRSSALCNGHMLLQLPWRHHESCSTHM